MAKKFNPEVEIGAKQDPETELVLFGNYPKIIGRILNNKQENMCDCIHKVIGLVIMKMKMKMKTR